MAKMRERRSTFIQRRAARLITLACMLITGCSSMGVHTPTLNALNYGEPLSMQVCVLRAPDVSEARVGELIDAVNKEFKPYGIHVDVMWTREWRRQGFTYRKSAQDLANHRLEAPCDRLVGFVGRNPGDVAWSMVMPEVLGHVDDATHTRAYIVANSASLNQLVKPPADIAIHEFYHLLGCQHASTLKTCYSVIAQLKRQARPGEDFFPTVRADGRYVLTRGESNFLASQGPAPKTNPDR